MQISLSCLFKYKKSLRIHERNDQMHITVFSAGFFFLSLSLSLRAEGPGFESGLRLGFFGVESYQWLKNWHSSGYTARHLVL